MRKIISAITLFLLSTLILWGQANIQGRYVVGSLPKPSYNNKATGTVVVQVKIDQYGLVTEAIAGADGTTTTDKDLWNAARNAALKAHFNQNANAPSIQTGTITYHFKNGSDNSASDYCNQQTESIVEIKTLVDVLERGTFTIKGSFAGVHDYSQLIFLIEEDDYIIPVKLVQNDLGAEKRFAALGMREGDSLVVKGRLSSIDIDSHDYKGLVDAFIVPGSIIRQTLREEKNEVQPSFQGGDLQAFSVWVNERLQYPQQAKDNGIQGRVTLQFAIEEDGRVTNIKVLRGVDEYLDKEAVRVVASSPKWDPGTINGEPGKFTFTFPVIFSLR